MVERQNDKVYDGEPRKSVPSGSSTPLTPQGHSSSPEGTTADFSKLDIDLQIKQAEADGNVGLLHALRALRAKGVGKGTILGAAAGFEGPEQRWWQCPFCKTYVDALISDASDVLRLYFEEALTCPVCNSSGVHFETVENNYFLPNRDDGSIVQLPGLVRLGLHRTVVQAVEGAQKTIGELGLFSADPQFDKDEPRWPKDLAVVILGVGAYLGEMLHTLVGATLKTRDALVGRTFHGPKPLTGHHSRSTQGHPPAQGEAAGFGYEKDESPPIL